MVLRNNFDMKKQNSNHSIKKKYDKFTKTLIIFTELNMEIYSNIDIYFLGALKATNSDMFRLSEE